MTDKQKEPVKLTDRQSWKVELLIRQDCTDDMTPERMKSWLKKQFAGCDYGSVEITNVEELTGQDA